MDGIKNMRVISQNKKYNVPFEICAFICTGNMIHALYGANQWLFAEYSTPEKAETIWNAFLNNTDECIYFSFPPDDLEREEK